METDTFHLWKLDLFHPHEMQSEAHGGVSRLVKDYTPLIHGISPFKFGFKWVLYGL